MIKQKIKDVLNNKSLSVEDKLISVNQIINDADPDVIDIPGLGQMTKKGNTIVIDGGKAAGVVWTDHPRLMQPNDIYYDCGCTWGVDLDGKRFWKLFDWYDKLDKKERGYNRYTDPVRGELYKFEEIYNFDEWLKRKVVNIVRELDNTI